MTIITTFEHAYLTQPDFPNPSDFDWLLEQNFDGFTIERKNHQWRIKVSHYVGVIGLPSGMQLEILPKITQTHLKSDADITATRQWLQQMLLDTWHALTPKNLPNLAKQTAIYPQLIVSDWLNQLFWQRFQTYQPNQQYQRFEQNQPFLQGKLLVKQQLQHNHHQPHKFFHQSEQFAFDTACNRLVKTAYQTIISRFHFALPSDWQTVQTLLPSNYQATFDQAKQELQALPTIITQQNFAFISLCYSLLNFQQGVGKGQDPHQSLLFNMQFAFEKWVTLKIQQQFSQSSKHAQVIAQMTQPLTAKGELTIKPDGWLKDENGITVFDVKWKNIVTVKDISLADMYQLMTYASEFEAHEAWLIVPTLDKDRVKQEIILAKANRCRFYLVLFYVNKGQLGK